MILDFLNFFYWLFHTLVKLFLKDFDMPYYWTLWMLIAINLARTGLFSIHKLISNNPWTLNMKNSITRNLSAFPNYTLLLLTNWAFWLTKIQIPIEIKLPILVFYVQIESTAEMNKENWVSFRSIENSCTDRTHQTTQFVFRHLTFDTNELLEPIY